MKNGRREKKLYFKADITYVQDFETDSKQSHYKFADISSRVIEF